MTCLRYHSYLCVKIKNSSGPLTSHTIKPDSVDRKQVVQSVLLSLWVPTKSNKAILGTSPGTAIYQSLEEGYQLPHGHTRAPQ